MRWRNWRKLNKERLRRREAEAENTTSIHVQPLNFPDDKTLWNFSKAWPTRWRGRGRREVLSGLHEESEFKLWRHCSASSTRAESVSSLAKRFVRKMQLAFLSLVNPVAIGAGLSANNTFGCPFTSTRTIAWNSTGLNARRTYLVYTRFAEIAISVAYCELRK